VSRTQDKTCEVGVRVSGGKVSSEGESRGRELRPMSRAWDEVPYWWDEGMSQQAGHSV
jgi:hypothetical protein